MARRQTAPDTGGPGPRYAAYFRIRFVAEAFTLGALVEHLRHAPESVDVAVWHDNTVVAVVRPDGTLVELPQTGRGPAVDFEPGPALTRRDVFAGLTAAALAGAVAASGVAFDVPEIVRQALGVADGLIGALEAP
jgi:hypothetical protein